ncbi:MAG: cellulase family glycosylhydrolase, partial [Ruminococcus sp.]|nr:cellulase family glycosylhydrolase [Ruminococcus sp.]
SAETAALNDVVIPNGGNIAISVHYYAPWKFSGGSTTVFDANGKAELDAKFAELKNKFVDKGIPVVIGEFGCVGVADDAVRAQYYQYYISSAKKHGIKCFIWDNGLENGNTGFAIFNRGRLSWNTTILNGAIEGAE